MKWFQWALILTILVIGITASIKTPEPKHEPRYNLERGGKWLSREAFQRSGTWRLSIEWVDDRSRAWTYGTYDGALEDAKNWGGIPVEVKAEE